MELDSPSLLSILEKYTDCSEVNKVSDFGVSSFSRCYKVDTDQGNFFIKTTEKYDLAMYSSEANALSLIRQTATLHVPQVFGFGSEQGVHFLILEYLECKSPDEKCQKKLGEQLAKMHLTRVPWSFGYNESTYLGSTKQQNPWSKNWVEFYARFRLMPLLKQLNDPKVLDRGEELIDELPSFFEGISMRPSILHGDLWSGNFSSLKDGSPVVFDPASYFGHYEADLSMMGMFGGFTSSFFDAYHRLLPKEPGFEERIKIYRLYHYLNHYILFGSSYRNYCLTLLGELLD